MYCNNRASWTVLCGSLAPSSGSTLGDFDGGSSEPTGGPTQFIPLDASTDGPTSAPMAKPVAAMTEPPILVVTRTDTDNLDSVPTIGRDTNLLAEESIETSDSNLEDEAEQTPLPSVTVRTDTGNSSEDGGSGGFPALGYAAIGMGAVLAVGAGVIIYTELGQRALLSAAQ